MKNNIDDTTEEYASDLKKKIEEAKIEKENKLKQEALKDDSAYESVEENDSFIIQENEGSIDRLREMKSDFEDVKPENDDIVLETVEFEVGPEVEEDDDLEKTRIVNSSMNAQASKEAKHQEPKKKEKDKEFKDLTPKEKKKNKAVTITIISIIVLVLAGGTIAGIKIFGGGSKDTSAVVEKDKTKDKTKDKKKEEKKDDKKTESKEDASINDAQKAALQGQIDSNATSIATLENEIAGHRDEIATITTQITTVESYERSLAILKGDLEQKYVSLTKEESPTNNHKTTMEEISKSLDSMGCVSIVNDAAGARNGIDVCIQQIEAKIPAEYPNYYASTTEQLKEDLHTKINNIEGMISSKNSKIEGLRSESATKQKELDELK